MASRCDSNSPGTKLSGDPAVGASNDLGNSTARFGVSITGELCEIAAHAGSTCHCGNSTDKTGMNSIATMATSQTKWRIAAESRFSMTATQAAPSRITLPLIAESISSKLEVPNTRPKDVRARFISTSLFLGLFD